MNFLNIATGKPETLEDHKVAPALALGTHTPADGARAMVTPTGGFELVPFEQLHAAAQAGYTVPTQPQLDDFAGRAKYGDGGGDAFKAFGAGLARGATFSLSDPLLVGSGLASQETLTGLKEFNPAASTAGEVAGAVGSAVMMPETSLPGLASKLGRAVTAKVLPEGAGALATIGAHAAGLGVEGALYGASPSISEAALGDPQGAAEHLVANVGMGAVLGGALGGVLTAGAMAVPKSVGVAKGAVAKGWRALFGDVAPAAEKEPFFTAGPNALPPAVAPEVGLPEAASPVKPDLSPPGAAPELKPGYLPTKIAEWNEAATGTPIAETLASFQARGQNPGEFLSNKQQAEFQVQIIDSIQETYDAMERASRDTSNLIRPRESATLLVNADPAAAQAELAQIQGVFQHTITKMRSAPDMYPGRFPAKLEEMLEGLETGTHAGSTSAEIYQEITRTRKLIDKTLKWGKELTGDGKDAGQLTEKLRGKFKDVLENEDVFGAAAARTAASNDTLNGYLNVKKEFNRRWMEQVGNRRGRTDWKVRPKSVTEFLNQINDVRGRVRGDVLKEFFRTSYAHIEQMEQSHGSLIGPTSRQSFDRGALESLMKKNNSQLTRAQDVVKGQPGMGFGGMHNLWQMATNPIAGAAAFGRGMSKAGTPDGMASVLANIERKTMTTEKAISRGMRGLFKPVGAALKKGYGVISEKLSPEQKLERIRRNIDETQAHTESTDNLATNLHEATKDGAHIAPQTMAAVQATVLRGLQFLQSKIPPLPPGTPFEEPPERTRDQLETFQRYYDTVHDPLSVLGELRSGTLATESVEALAAVYPQLYSRLQQAAVEHVAKVRDKSAIPYKTRLVMSQFMGQPMDQSLSPLALQAVAAAHATAAAQKPAPAAGGASPLTLAQRTGTAWGSGPRSKRV